MSKYVPSAHEIETFSGRFVDVSNPSADSIVLEDIAHALGAICRYGGHCKTFYSVAEHAVFVSRRLERQGHGPIRQLAGLHHDDSEAFLGDIPRPMKPLLGARYKQMTDRMDKAIVEALGLKHEHYVAHHAFHDDEVKAADNWALMVEARHLLPSEGRLWFDGAQGAAHWDLPEMPSRIVTPDYWHGGLDPDDAATLFIQRHEELTTSL